MIVKKEHHYESWYDMNCSCFLDHGYSSTVVGGLRNDSANKMIYFWSNNSNSECILYDFNLTPGDSALWTFNCSPTLYVHILSYDSTQVGSQFNKSVKHDGDLNQYPFLVEGMGSLSGLFEPYSYFEDFGQLVCFSINGQIKYQNNGFGCGIVGENKLIDEAGIQVSVYPNPSSKDLNISASEKIISLEIFDLLGNQVFSKSSGSMSETINLAGPQGIYFIKIYFEKGKYSVSRIIKQ